MTPMPWYAIKSPENLVSPALLVYPDRIARNIRLMIEMAGGTERLRPHVKTHKMAEIIEMQLQQGIDKFKCATIAEAELLAGCGATDVLLALQPVGINQRRFLDLQQAFPGTGFSTIIDDMDNARLLSALSIKRGMKVRVYMDINVGMDRTGIRPDKKGLELYHLLASLPGIGLAGFHVYDGHIRNSDFEERKAACDAAFRPVLELKGLLEQEGLEVPSIVVGGSPSFPVHASRNNVETSPGTTLLWDAGYGRSFPDMKFEPAAVLLCRIISKPGNNLLCLDLGHKAIAPEMPFPRVLLLGMEHCSQQSQSEEHLVVQCNSPDDYRLGDVCYAIPMHICPTVAKYPSVLTVEEGKVTGNWKVAARDHRLTI